MTVRVEVVTPCVHEGDCPVLAYPDGVPYTPCPGESRRTFTEWPHETKVVMQAFLMEHFDCDDPDAVDELADRLWDHITKETDDER